MPACSYRPPSPDIWTCGNSLTITMSPAARWGGGAVCTLGGTVKAPSTLLRGFPWGRVCQLDRLSRELLAWACQAGARPGDGALTPPYARPADWPRRGQATTACPVLDTGTIAASGAITRCWPWPPAPGRVDVPAARGLPRHRPRRRSASMPTPSLPSAAR